VSPVTAVDVKTVYLSLVFSGGRIIGVDAVDNEGISQAQIDEEILTFDIPDDALERAGSAERQAFTWVYCTNGYYWYDCNWPL